MAFARQKFGVMLIGAVFIVVFALRRTLFEEEVLPAPRAHHLEYHTSTVQLNEASNAHGEASGKFSAFHGRWRELVAFQGQRDGVITLTMLDGKYKRFARPWYLQALRLRSQNGNDNCVIIALDDEAYAQGVKDDLPVVKYECIVNKCEPLSAPDQRRSHFKISTLRILLNMGYHILLSEMDILLVKDPFTTPLLAEYGDAKLFLEGFARSTGPDMWLSSHCNHPRVNIGFVAIQSNARTRQFFHAYEDNWRASQQWDQSLWDSMLANHDQLREGRTLPTDPVTWAKIDARLVTDWQGGFQRGACSSNQSRMTCAEVVAYHLTNMPLAQKQGVMCRFYQMVDCPALDDGDDERGVKNVLNAMCNLSSHQP